MGACGQLLEAVRQVSKVPSQDAKETDLFAVGFDLVHIDATEEGIRNISCRRVIIDKEI